MIQVVRNIAYKKYHICCIINIVLKVNIYKCDHIQILTVFENVAFHLNRIL